MIRRKSLTNVGNILGSVLYGVISTTDIAAWNHLGTGWRNFISNTVTDIYLPHIDSNIRSPNTQYLSYRSSVYHFRTLISSAKQIDVHGDLKQKIFPFPK